MGEMADDMIEGRACELCGSFFVKSESSAGEVILMEHGYPVTCWECWEDLSSAEKRGRIKAKAPTL